MDLDYLGAWRATVSYSTNFRSRRALTSAGLIVIFNTLVLQRSKAAADEAWRRDIESVVDAASGVRSVRISFIQAFFWARRTELCERTM